MSLGTVAHKQGRVAGENAVCGQTEFKGSLGTQVVNISDLVIARPGLRDQEAMDEDFDPLTVQADSWDHKAYYPGATKVRNRIRGDLKRRILE